jgi:Tfp pilus assembly major pilin PilA
MIIIDMKKKRLGLLSLVELIIVMVIIGVLGSIAIPASKDYERRARWSKTLAMTTKPLQQAISKCLNNTKGNIIACNDFSPNKLAKYGVAAAPKDKGYFLAVYVVKSNAAIKIVGSKCIADLIPHPLNPTDWDIVISVPEYGDDSVEKCKSLIRSELAVIK